MKKSYAAKCLLILLSIFILTSCSRNNKTKNEYIGTIHKTNYSEQHKIQLPKTVSCISAENEFYILDEKGTVTKVSANGEATVQIDGQDSNTVVSLAVGKTSVFLIEQLNQSIRIIDILSNNEPVYITGQIAGSVGAAIYTDETLVLNDSTTGMLTIINTQGGQTKLIKDVPVCAIACIENEIFCLLRSADTKTYQISTLNIQQASLELYMDTGIPYSNAASKCSLYSDADGNFIVMDAQAAYRCNQEKGQSECFLLWQELNVLYMKDIAISSTGIILGLYGEDNCVLLAADVEDSATVQSPLSSESIENEKTVLTIATVNDDYDHAEVLKRLALLYNIQNEAGIKIEVHDYAQDKTNSDDAMLALTTDLITGNAPDILDCSILSGLQLASYSKNGVLEVIDEITSDDKLLSSVMQPCYIDGHAYSAVCSFTLTPLFVATSKLPHSLEKSVDDVIQGHMDGVCFDWRGEDLLRIYSEYACESYLNYDTNTSNFTCESFECILSFCANSTEDQANGSPVVQQPLPSIAAYRTLQNLYFEATGVGVRILALNADGGTTYSDGIHLGICAGSKNVTAAKSVLMDFLSENLQKQLPTGFPVNREVLQDQLYAEIGQQSKEFLDSQQQPSEGKVGAPVFLFDETTAADLMYVLENANCRRCDNQEIINIIMDEAAPLFAGEKTADEVAMLIDNRVALLLSEIN